jgi:hypothetical protein
MVPSVHLLLVHHSLGLNLLATANPPPEALTFTQVVQALSALHNLLERIEQADRAALYQALGLTVSYRRVGMSEQVKLSSMLRTVDLERCRRTDWQPRSTPGRDGK